jgi:hypothetical protein
MLKTTWKIYQIQHRRSPEAPTTTRYQFTDGKGKRRHFATKAEAKLQAAKDRALYHQEGRLAAGLTDEQRRDAALAVKHLPAGWTLTRAANAGATRKTGSSAAIRGSGLGSGPSFSQL